MSYHDLLQTSLPEINKSIAEYFGIPIIVVAIIVAIIGIWAITWKGLALWKSARKNHLAWFIAILLINTIGILEILYIYVFSEMKFNKKKSKKRK